jgi:plasmid stabilization system protein ParE
MPRNAVPKRLEWARAAQEAFEATIELIASEDTHTARLVVQRVDNALIQLRSYPKLGRAAGARGVRALPIPRTGHLINYRETRNAIRILRWYRAKQNVPPSM